MPEQADIWGRLARLDHSCHVSVHSLYIPDQTGACHREWEVVIRLKGLGMPDPVCVRGRTLVDSLSLALDRAEALGWPPMAVSK